MTEFNKIFDDLMERTSLGMPENSGDLYDDWGMSSTGQSKSKFTQSHSPKKTKEELPELVKCPKCGYTFRNIENE